MNTLQITPVTGVQTPSASTAPSVGEAVFVASQSTGHRSPSAAENAAAASAAAAKARAEAAAAAEGPAFDLKVGLVSGTFDVYVDLTDSVDHRVVARLYGPRGETIEPPVPQQSAEA